MILVRSPTWAGAAGAASAFGGQGARCSTRHWPSILAHSPAWAATRAPQRRQVPANLLIIVVSPGSGCQRLLTRSTLAKDDRLDQSRFYIFIGIGQAVANKRRLYKTVTWATAWMVRSARRASRTSMASSRQRRSG